MSKKAIKKKLNEYRSEQVTQDRKIEGLTSEVRRMKHFLALGAGYFISTIGGVGVIGTIYIDILRKRPLEWQWMQITALGLFMFIFLIGAAFVSWLLKTNKELQDDDEKKEAYMARVRMASHSGGKHDV